MTGSFRIDEVEFVVDLRPGPARGVSDTNRFILVKNDGCLDFYRRWPGPPPRTIMEIGLFQGGSLVFFDKLFRPERIVGVDIRPEPIAALERYREGRPHVRTVYGRSQDAAGTLMAARENFPAGIDLVVDDASHLYARTRATFEMLFPLVRAGGHYVIEDWAWSHQPAHQGAGATWEREPALTNLVLELVVAAGAYGVVDQLLVTRELVCVCKGRGKLPDAPFDFAGVLRGRALPRI